MTTQAVSLKLDGRTSMRVIVARVESDPRQMDLFEDQSEAWANDMIRFALKMPSPFFFSELRLHAAHEPPHASWWGALTRKLKKAGFIQTGTFRRSPRESRKGGVDFQWQRKP